MTLLLMTCLQELFFRLVSSDAFFQTHLASNKFLCSWTCSIRIFMNSTLIMDPVHLNKLFSISNWLFLIPCYCQNSIGDFWNTLCSNKVVSTDLSKWHHTTHKENFDQNQKTRELNNSVDQYIYKHLSHIFFVSWLLSST